MGWRGYAKRAELPRLFEAPPTATRSSSALPGCVVTAFWTQRGPANAVSAEFLLQNYHPAPVRCERTETERHCHPFFHRLTQMVYNHSFARSSWVNLCANQDTGPNFQRLANAIRLCCTCNLWRDHNTPPICEGTVISLA
eukprot:9488973-Pyramimonas_sp.AAC.4